jgi:SpoVK/Ycf46/Vps4 family AAA+-type ATPase
MAEVTLQRLRILRQRAEDLLRFARSDLTPFLHKKDHETFRRKPESPSIRGDVNVTTTCSCLMALALTNGFRDFYQVQRDEAQVKNKAHSVFKRLMEAPWMSSGLTANNAFSSALMLRTFGFLMEKGFLNAAKVEKKEWELALGIINEKVTDFANYLAKHSDAPAKFLYSSVSDISREAVNKPIPHEKEEADRHRKILTNALALDLRRLIQSGSIYSEERFPRATKTTKRKLEKLPTGYALARLNQRLFIEQFPDFFSKVSKITIPEIATQMADDAGNFAINEYSPSTAVLYWFTDGLVRGKIYLDASKWNNICRWATHSFNRERSLVLANHDAMMDPLAMAMAACLCAKLRALAAKAELGTDKAHREMLPSMIELEHSSLELFKRQAPSGIWPKYFPLFHYQEAGSNFCFTFELLEALLCEFGGAENTLLDQVCFIKGLEEALTWCERNRLKCSVESKEYTGWNSGGDIETLKKERPESWATAVVHMFLWELTSVLSERIQKRILEKYKARPPKVPVEDMLKSINPKLDYFGKAIDKLQDIDLFFEPHHDSLSRVLRDELLEANFGKVESQIRRNKSKSPLSALLFGPPGTSKTQVTKAIADDLGWPMLEINPSEFVKGSFANVYLQAEEIFTDLMDLSAVVVLFDEMDALTQKRGSNEHSTNHLDTATQFLTTSMLPKLTALHDKGGVVFLMATNFQENFDPAIKRAGRFDLLLCMGPPKLDEKIDKLHLFFDPIQKSDQLNLAKKRIREYLKNSPTHSDMLELFTFGDFKSFLKRIGDADDIGQKIQDLKKPGFLKAVKDSSKTIGLRYEDLQLLPKKVRPHTLKEIDKLKPSILAKLKKTELGRYFRDRRESKRQF